jgi:riboflavin synthase
MFTGIIASLGEVKAATQNQLVIFAKPLAAQVSIGESVAINGVCLTVVAIDSGKNLVEFDLSPETSQRTTLGHLQQADWVNLERALAVGERLSGHLMQGHVDTTGEVVKVQSQNDSYLFTFRVDGQYSAWLVEKGSVAIDGISLTPFHINHGQFEVAVIPHTFATTTLQYRKTGDKVNIEFDILAKYVQKQLRKEEFNGLQHN